MMNWILGTGVAVSLLIILVLLVRRPFARMFGAKAAYALWVLPFLRLVMPEVTLPRFLPRIFQPSSPETAAPNEIVITPEMIALMPQAEPSLMSQIEPYLIPGLFTIWAVGVLIFFLYHWTALASLMDRLTLKSEPASELESEIISAARAAKLKQIPAVRISDEKVGPLVAGFICPTVILPHDFMNAFSPKQHHYALMHEFMHIKRGDVWVALAWLMFRAVNWPNPLVHYAAKYFRSDQEAACDASVLNALEKGERESTDAVTGYAETLIHAAKTAMTSQTENGRASPKPSALALTIHHPLKERLMILGSPRKTSTWRSRTAAAVMIIGAATLSAPLIQADAHPEKKMPEEELAGKHDSHQGKSVIKRTYKKDGETVSEHYEVLVDGNKVEAFRVEPSGQKIRVEIEGVDVADVGNGFSRTVTISDDEGVKIMSRDDFKKWAKTEYPEWKKNDFASWVDGDFKTWTSKKNKGKTILHDESGEARYEYRNMHKFPKPPKFTKNSDNVFVLEGKNIRGLEGLKALKSLKRLENLEGLNELKGLEALEGLDALESLKGLEALKVLKNLDNTKSYSFYTDDDNEVNVKMLSMTESKLAAARSLLENTEVEAGDSREMAKVKRELDKARKALRAAERALKDAQ